MARWVGDFAPYGWFGILKGRTLGAYISGTFETPEALIAVRYERDLSTMRHAVFGRHILIVDELVIAPSVPDHVRSLLHAAIVQSLLALGEFHGQTVTFMIDDFGI